MGYFMILAAIPGFFLSALFLWLLWDVVAPLVGLTPGLSYVNSMLVTVTLWIAVAPLAGAARRKKR
jgi:hypothetical protein